MAVAGLDFTSRELKMNTHVTICFPDSVRSGGIPLSRRKVLWLLHGLSDDDTAWLRYSRIDKYAMEQNLVVVMPAVGRSMYCDDVLGQNYFSFVAEELPEYLSLVFGLSRKKEDNFIAGLSMGGMGAMKIALTHPDRYTAVGSFSGVLHLGPLALVATEETKKEFPFLLPALEDLEHSPLNPSALLDAEKDRDLRIYVSCGLQDDLLIANHLFKQQADEAGVDITYITEDGTHEWGFWDRHVQKFIEWMQR